MGIQDFGTAFDLKSLYRARHVAREITYKLRAQLHPGTTEEEAHTLYKKICQDYGVEKQWHPPKLRMGPNTIKNFREISDPYSLQENDVFFIDIGPVIDGHEADYGETFALGNEGEHKRIVDASKRIFDEVALHWKEHRISGQPLYEFAEGRAKEMGYTLNLEMDGHRIGDFPHHLFFKGGSSLNVKKKSFQTPGYLRSIYGNLIKGLVPFMRIY